MEKKQQWSRKEKIKIDIQKFIDTFQTDLLPIIHLYNQ